MKFSIYMHCNVVANHIYYYQTTTKYIFGHIAKNAFSKNWISGVMVTKRNAV